MTDQREPGAAVPAAPSPAEPSAPYRDLVALRKAHLDLRDPASATNSSSTSSDSAARIRAFLANARKTGAVLIDPGERKAAQGILDYWSAELAGNPGAQPEDFVPVMLAPPDARQTFNQLDQPASTAPVNKVDQRALVRLSALARQWRDSDKQPGYLLSGDTIEEAARFKGLDTNLDEFVQASRQAVERKHRNRTIVFSGIAGAALTVALLCFGAWYFSVAAKTAERFIIQWATKSSAPAAALRWLDFLQPLLAPYDLSGTPKFTKVSVPKLRLYAPNFSGVEFSEVDFQGATLPAASFSGSAFSFDGGGNNDFGRAVLRQAQFRGARIARTSFEGAHLYRASFDRAVLCDVDFTGANLRAASFWAVTLNDRTKETIRRTAWWLALGWPWSEIEKLAPPRQGPANAADDDRLQKSLKNSSGFKDDIQRPIDSIQRSPPGTIERALALNNLAWTDAIWGIDITESRHDPARAGHQSPSDPCAAGGMPESARQAAQQAVCIVGKLNNEEDKKGKYTALLSNLRDTLAYVLMQNDEMALAMATFEEIARDDPKSLEEGDISFRYAIAQYATTPDKKAAAVERLKNAIENGRYQPTHELQTLRDHIFPVNEFVEVLKTSANKIWPPVPNSTQCPARNPASAR